MKQVSSIKPCNLPSFSMIFPTLGEFKKLTLACIILNYNLFGRSHNRISDFLGHGKAYYFKKLSVDEI